MDCTDVRDIVRNDFLSKVRPEVYTLQPIRKISKKMSGDSLEEE
jgi:hypothetical protein